MDVTSTHTPSVSQAPAQDIDRNSVIEINNGQIYFSFDPTDRDSRFSIHDGAIKTVWSCESVGNTKWTELTFCDLSGRRAVVTFYGMTKIELLTAILSAPDRF